MKIDFEENECIEELLINGYKIVQNRNGYRFNIDSVILANFVDKQQLLKKVLEIGAGNGVISMLLAALGANSIVAVEIQNEMASMALKSLKLNNIDSIIEIVNNDIIDYIKHTDTKFSTVVANPPYFKKGTGRLNSNNQIAIARHELYLSLEQLLSAVASLLTHDGFFYFCHVANRVDEILLQSSEMGLFVDRVRFVHSNNTANANIVLFRAQKKRKKIEIMKPLFVYENENYSREVLSYYE